MVQFLSIIFFFFGFLQFLLGFSKVPVFLCHPVYALDDAGVAVGSFTVTNSDVSSHDLLLGIEVVEKLKIGYVQSGACLLAVVKFTKTLIRTQRTYSNA